MQGSQTDNWLHFWGALIVAFVALIQPWILALYRRIFQAPTVQAFHAGNIEIGYSAFGPTVGLNGTLTVKNKDVFIQAIDLEVVRLKDHSTHKYEWSYFRSNKVRLSQLTDMEVELAAGFILSIRQPHRYNILFIENKAQQELVSDLQKLSKAWNEFFLSKVVEISKDTSNASFDQIRPAIYDEFSHSPIHVDTWGKVDRARYWEVGDYSVTMTVKTSNPDKSFSFDWGFSLDETNATLLSYNSSEILRTMCGSGTGTWNFGNCAYK